MNARLYTLAEAQAVLPRVRPLLEALAQANAELARVQNMAGEMRRSALGNGHLSADPWDETTERESPVAVAQQTIRRCMVELTGLGIEVKDPARGLIDFYHEREGRVVYLCYLLGEPEIAYWHTLEGGFAARQPI